MMQLANRQSVHCMRCRTVRSLIIIIKRIRRMAYTVTTSMLRRIELSRATVKWQWVQDWRSANAEGSRREQQRHARHWQYNSLSNSNYGWRCEWIMFDRPAGVPCWRSRLSRRHLRSIWASTSRCAPAHATFDRRPSHCCACQFDGYHLPDDRSALPHLWLGTHCHLLC